MDLRFMGVDFHMGYQDVGHFDKIGFDFIRGTYTTYSDLIQKF